MQIEITRKFRKQVDDCKDQRTRSKILGIIESVIFAAFDHRSDIYKYFP
jgi:mRNA-degrading endonuclease RelE of RelBE toxin-antitoxin system